MTISEIGVDDMAFHVVAKAWLLKQQPCLSAKKHKNQVNSSEEPFYLPFFLDKVNSSLQFVII